MEASGERAVRQKLSNGGFRVGDLHVQELTSQVGRGLWKAWLTDRGGLDSRARTLSTLPTSPSACGKGAPSERRVRNTRWRNTRRERIAKQYDSVKECRQVVETVGWIAMMREETKDAEGGGHGGVLAFKPARPAAGTSPEQPRRREPPPAIVRGDALVRASGRGDALTGLR